MYYWLISTSNYPISELSRQIPSEGSQMVAPQSPPTGLCIHFIDIGIGQVLTIILLFPKGSEPGAIAIAQSQQENQSRKSKA